MNEFRSFIELTDAELDAVAGGLGFQARVLEAQHKPPEGERWEKPLVAKAASAAIQDRLYKKGVGSLWPTVSLRKFRIPKQTELI